MTMTIYDNLHSVYARRVRLLAAELELPLVRVTLHYFKGDLGTPAHLARNPGGRIPALDDDGFVVWESIAIVKYLAALRPERGMSPAGARERAIIDQWLNWWTTHPAAAIAALAQERLVKPMKGEAGHAANIIAAAEAALARDLPILEAQLSGRDYVLGDLGVVDFVIGPQIAALEKVGVAVGDYPHIQALAQRLQAKPYWAEA